MLFEPNLDHDLNLNPNLNPNHDLNPNLDHDHDSDPNLDHNLNPNPNVVVLFFLYLIFLFVNMLSPVCTIVVI